VLLGKVPEASTCRDICNDELFLSSSCDIISTNETITECSVVLLLLLIVSFKKWSAEISKLFFSFPCKVLVNFASIKSTITE